MTGKFIFWAQALDNSSPDHFDAHGRALEPDDAVQRQQAVSCVSRVIKNGKRLFEQSGVLLTADAGHFVVEVPSAQRDSVGRIAPIVCYGEYDAAAGDAQWELALVALDDFAKRIGRNIQPEHFETARASFEALKKKSSKTKLTLVVGVCAFLILVIVYVLALKKWQTAY